MPSDKLICFIINLILMLFGSSGIMMAFFIYLKNRHHLIPSYILTLLFWILSQLNLIAFYFINEILAYNHSELNLIMEDISLITMGAFVFFLPHFMLQLFHLPFPTRWKNIHRITVGLTLIPYSTCFHYLNISHDLAGIIDLLRVIILYGILYWIVFFIKFKIRNVNHPFARTMYNLCFYCTLLFYPIMLYEGHHYFERIYPFGISSFHLFFFIQNLIWMYFAGQYIYLPELSLVDDNQDVSHFSHAHDLSKREIEIVMLLLEGKSYIQIAGDLFISPETVKTHIKKIYRKSGVSNKMELSQRIKKYNLK